MNRTKYLDPVLLTKIANLHLRARHVVEGFITGLHHSPYRGHSLEFAQHREYTPGDELRYIDWKVYGRSDHFFVKQFQEETNLRAYILLDISGSMSFGLPPRLSKMTYSIYLSACLAYLLLHQGDSVGIAIFDNKIQKFIPAGSQIMYLAPILDTLEAIQAGLDTSISKILRQFTQYLSRRALVLLISDLLDTPEDVLHSLKCLQAKHHEVIVFQVVDPAERELPYDGVIIFESMEPPYVKISTEPNIIRERYKELFDNFIREYKLALTRAGIDYCLLTTATPLEVALGIFLSHRSRQRYKAG